MRACAIASVLYTCTTVVPASCAAHHFHLQCAEGGGPSSVGSAAIWINIAALRGLRREGAKAIGKDLQVMSELRFEALHCARLIFIALCGNSRQHNLFVCRRQHSQVKPFLFENPALFLYEGWEGNHSAPVACLQLATWATARAGGREHLLQSTSLRCHRVGDGCQDRIALI